MAEQDVIARPWEPTEEEIEAIYVEWEEAQVGDTDDTDLVVEGGRLYNRTFWVYLNGDCPHYDRDVSHIVGGARRLDCPDCMEQLKEAIDG